jgi:hypothetical protein
VLSRTSLAAIFTGGAFVALAIAFVQVRASNSAHRDEMAELRASMRELRSELGRPRFAGSLDRTARPEAPASEASQHVVAEQAAGEAEAAASHEAPPKSFEEALQRSEAQFRDEAIDAAWAGATTSAVQHTLAMITPAGASVRGLSCHSTRCRLEMNLRDAASLDAFQREALYGSNILWRGQVKIDHDQLPDGSVAMVAHLLRETEH